jgi:hypothetical protein
VLHQSLRARSSPWFQIAARMSLRLESRIEGCAREQFRCGDNGGRSTRSGNFVFAVPVIANLTEDYHTPLRISLTTRIASTTAHPKLASYSRCFQ